MFYHSAIADGVANDTGVLCVLGAGRFVCYWDGVTSDRELRLCNNNNGSMAAMKGIYKHPRVKCTCS